MSVMDSSFEVTSFINDEITNYNRGFEAMDLTHRMSELEGLSRVLTQLAKEQLGNTDEHLKIDQAISSLLISLSNTQLSLVGKTTHQDSFKRLTVLKTGLTNLQQML